MRNGFKYLWKVIYKDGTTLSQFDGAQHKFSEINQKEVRYIEILEDSSILGFHTTHPVLRIKIPENVDELKIIRRTTIVQNFGEIGNNSVGARMEDDGRLGILETRYADYIFGWIKGDKKLMAHIAEWGNVTISEEF